MGVCLFGGVVVAHGQGEGPVEVPNGLRVQAQHGTGVAEASVGAAVGGGVGQVRGGVQRGPPHGELVAQVPLPEVEGVQCPGEVPDDVVAAESDRDAMGGQQGGVLGLQPGHRRSGVGQRVWVHAGRGRLESHEHAGGA